ncbi:hypothetical protein CSC2_40280 [Clostridium zeae]|uniref:OmpH family outer membrane protein n=1 Tax=Clostridium zeae TaxID=2759022 RepID=A0ABQ1EFA5_9CLOT|nr:hypothetical protein [Clostridium zeae]GFZ33502.1 hypothetical protein CSC2_40280 [Clostridium zeae]
MKKLIAFLFTFLLVSFGLGHNAFAATNDDNSDILAKIQQTNQQIQVLIDNAQIKGSEINQELDKKVVELENQKANYEGQQDKIAEIDKEIVKLREEANKEIDKLCLDLYNETEDLANAMVSEARAAGIDVEKEYFDYNIGGKIIAIDPVQVVD